MNLFERATAAHRTCGTCVTWGREWAHPAIDEKGNPEPFVMGLCSVKGLPTRGSDSCSKWTRLLRLNVNG